LVQFSWRDSSPGARLAVAAPLLLLLSLLLLLH
jgi:hypothetical protein